jgi:hypothetical protein
MAQPVVTTAQLSCSFGTTPSVYSALPTSKVTIDGQPAATIMDSKPMVNIKPFGMCQTPSNPQVAAATTAASGVLTPQPCIPAVVAPWTPGSPTVMGGFMPLVNNSSKCMCNWGGVISVSSAGATKTTTP